MKVLEIGSNPYFVTSILCHYLKFHLDCITRPSTIWPGTPYKEKKNCRLRYIKVFNQKYLIKEYICNVEKDRFPFQSDTYDLVIANEIIEKSTIKLQRFKHQLRKHIDIY